MKKLWLGFAAFVCGQSLIFGYDTDIRHHAALDQTSQLVSSLRLALAPDDEEPVNASNDNGNANGNGNSGASSIGNTLPVYPVAVAQESLSGWNSNANGSGNGNGNGGGNDYFFHSELERLSNAIEVLQRPATPPNTRNAWGAPRLGGRIFVDSVNFVNQNTESRKPVADGGNGNLHNSAGFRDLRLGVTGSGYESFDYRAEFSYNASNGSVTLTDVWIGAQNIPLLGYLRVGHIRPETGQYFPMGSQNLTTLWYPGSASVFGLQRRVGITSQHLFADDRIRFAAGIFQSEPTQDARFIARDNQGQTVNLRLTGTPVFEDEGKYLFHVGGHWAYVGAAGASGPANNPGKSASLGTAPGSLGPGVGNTLTSGAFANDYSNRGGVEIAYQNNRFSARSEYYVGSFGAYDGRTSAGIPSETGRKLHGTYVELAYFLTDGFRIYNPNSALFTGVKMNHNFRPLKRQDRYIFDGVGAWQAVFQWSYTDMTDWRNNVTTVVNTDTGQTRTDMYGGHQNDFVAGLNWYWTPQVRCVFQYVHSRQNVGTDYSKRSQDIFGTSLRVHF